MPSRKILVILIVCLGAVGAVWILERPGADVAGALNAPIADVAVESGTSSEASINWQNILGNVQSTTTMASGLSNVGTDSSSGDTTLTSQLAKDFMARYLLAQGQQTQSGVDTSNGLDSNTTDQIAGDVLSSGSYTANQAVIYTAKNLNIQSNSNETTFMNYVDILDQNSNQMAGSENKNGNEVDIMNSAILNQDQKEIAKLDPIIQSYQTLLTNMLKVPVPGDATSLHLELVNDLSKILSDLQAIRQTFTDPVKALSAVNTYKQDYTNLVLVVQKLEVYTEMKAENFKN
jgi:hypothetical protein